MAWQIFLLLTHWLPNRTLVFVGDNSFATLDLLYAVSQRPNASLIARLRLDAGL